MNEVILKAENVHTGRLADLIGVDVFFGERIVYVMRYTDSGDTFRMDESYETDWIEIEE